MSCILTSGGNVAAKHSAKKVEGDDGLKTIESLRGRLFSERVASKAVNEEADNLGNKLIELENKLKEEVKWRNRAEKRLKSLVKKLEPMKLVYVVSDESSSLSTSFGKSELGISSSSSSSSSLTYPYRQPEDNNRKKPNSQMRRSPECELDEPVVKNGDTLNHTDIDNASCEYQSFSSNEKITCGKTISEKFYDESQSTRFSDDHRSKFSTEDRDTNGVSRQDWDKSTVDNSMALVPVNILAKTQNTVTIEPLIANNARVEDVLDTLSHAKERLKSSMERRHMIRVGL